MKLSLCMIVRNNERIIGECLTSIRPWVDEMVVVDTGSTDNTPQIAKDLGARLFEFPWIDDFSAARNESLRHARGQWLFWMDSDDVIDEASGQRLRALADAEHPAKVLGYVMQVHCPGPAGESGGDVTVVDHVKMFRNSPDLRFEGRIHEQILPAIRRAGGDVAWGDVHVVHKHGSVTEEERRKKHERDLRILEADLKERPDHPFVLFNLGMTYADMEQPQEAVGYLQRSIDVAGPDESHLRKAFALLAAAHLQLSQTDQADNVCTEARRRFPDDPEITFRSALVAHQSGQPQQAIDFYRQVIASPHTESDAAKHFSSRDVGIVGHKARHNLAVVLSEIGDWAEAELQWRYALEEAPLFRSASLGLLESLLAQGKLVTAQVQARTWESDEKLRWLGLLLGSKLAARRGETPQAIDLAKEANRIEESAREPLDELSRLLFETGQTSEAKRTLTRLASLCPDDPVVHKNLGSVHLALGNRAEAIAALETSLSLRPDAVDTRRLLEQTKSQTA